MWLNVEEKENTFLTPKLLDLRELSVIRTQQMINPYNTIPGAQADSNECH